MRLQAVNGRLDKMKLVSTEVGGRMVVLKLEDESGQ